MILGFAFIALILAEWKFILLIVFLAVVSIFGIRCPDM